MISRVRGWGLNRHILMRISAGNLGKIVKEERLAEAAIMSVANCSDLLLLISFSNTWNREREMEMDWLWGLEKGWEEGALQSEDAAISAISFL